MSKSISLIAVLLAKIFFLSSPQASEFRSQQGLSRTDISSAITEYRLEHEADILREFFELLRLPNDASVESDIRANADRIVSLLQRRGVAAELLEFEAGPPAVYGELLTPGAETTILFYVHYDGQPVTPENWLGAPYSPDLRDAQGDGFGDAYGIDQAVFPIDPATRIFARSASDDKAPVIGLMAALDALRAGDIPLSVNIKFFFDGEEEAGSPHLAQMLKKHASLLSSDIMIFCDGPVHQSGKNQMIFGVRGAVDFHVTVYGPGRPLHSGHYGNYAPNPINMLAHLLASMRDGDGRILIDGFYDNVIEPSDPERTAIAKLPPYDQQLRHDLVIGRQESDGLPYHEAVLWPALNYKGILSADVGDKMRNIVPTTATASLGYRLVPNQTPQQLVQLTERHIKSLGYHIVHDNPSAELRKKYKKVAKLTWEIEGGYPGSRTPIDAPASQALITIVTDVIEDELLLIPSFGGSLPIWHFQNALDVPVIILPIANYDNNQHAENENLRIQNLWSGIELYGNIMALFGERYQASAF